MSSVADLLSRDNVLKLLVAFFLVRIIYGAVYRLILSPIAKFPGPKLAALTFWNEFYYDVVQQGQYTFKLEDYHQRYGKYWVPMPA